MGGEYCLTVNYGKNGGDKGAGIAQFVVVFMDISDGSFALYISATSAGPPSRTLVVDEDLL